MLAEAMLGERVEECDVVHQRQREAADQRDPSEPTGSEYGDRQRHHGCGLHHGTGHLAHPTGRRGDVVQHPFAVARAKATTKRVPEPAKRVWPSWGSRLCHPFIIAVLPIHVVTADTHPYPLWPARRAHPPPGAKSQPAQSLVPARRIRAYLLAGAASTAGGAGRHPASRSLAGSRHAKRAPAGRTIDESYAIVAARMRPLVALQTGQHLIVRHHVRKPESRYLATTPGGKAC
jgi:hypothetical protein